MKDVLAGAKVGRWQQVVVGCAQLLTATCIDQVLGPDMCGGGREGPATQQSHLLLHMKGCYVV